VQQTLKKIALEQTTLSVAMIPVFISVQGGLEGQSIAQIKYRIEQLWWPTLLMNWKVWPAANFFNFKYVPQQQRVFYAASISLLWSTYMSWIQHKKLPNVPSSTQERAH